MIYEGPYRTAEMRFSRRWWTQLARDLFWVALVSVLVWVYADRKVTETKTFVTTVRLTTGKSADLVVLEKTEWRGVIYKVEGSREALDHYERQAKESVSYDVSPQVAGDAKAFPRAISISVAEVLNQDRDIAGRGLKVTSAENPDTITARLDRLRTVAVPVELVYSKAELVDPPKPTVEIAVPESNWQEILKAQPNPAIRTVEKDLSGKPAGKPIPVTFDLIGEIASVSVRLGQNSIEVPVTISQTTDTIAMTASVRVLMMSGDWEDLRKFDLVVKDKAEWRPEIRITGATKDLVTLQPKDIEAYIVLTDDDKKPVESWLPPKPVQVRFPAALGLRLDGNPPTVTFKLQRRPEAAVTP